MSELVKYSEQTFESILARRVDAVNRKVTYGKFEYEWPLSL